MTLRILIVLSLTLTQLPLRAQTDDRWLGTWELDLTRSSFDSTVPFFGGTMPRRRTMRFEKMPNGIRHVTETATYELAETYRLEYTFQIDGRDYPADPQMPIETVTFRRVDASTLERVGKVRGGRVTHTVIYRVSADGRTLTATEEGTARDAAANEFPLRSVQVFVRQ